MAKHFSHAPLRLEKFFLEEFDGDAGGIVTFVGTPRRLSDGKEIVALEYEAYEAMAESCLDELIMKAMRRWSLSGVFLQHCLGRVPVGQASIIVQVRSPHRHEAFGASQFLVDGLKREVPIWKSENYADGTNAWVHCEHGVHGVEVEPSFLQVLK